jgi:hypothetical protein
MTKCIGTAPTPDSMSYNMQSTRFAKLADEMSVANDEVTHEHHAMGGGGVSSESLQGEYKIAVSPSFRMHRRRYPLNRFQRNLVYDNLRKRLALFHVSFRSGNFNHFT